MSRDIQKEITDLEERYQLATDKLSLLEKNKILETKADERFRLQYEVGELEKTRTLIEKEISHLKSLDKKSEKVANYKKELKQVGDEAVSLEKHLTRPQFKEAIRWINDNKEALAKTASKYIVTSGLTEKEIRWFCSEIRRFLELINGSLVVERYSLLDEPKLRMSLPVEEYLKALKYIRGRIPEHLPQEAITELKKSFDYLISRLR